MSAKRKANLEATFTEALGPLPPPPPRTPVAEAEAARFTGEAKPTAPATQAPLPAPADPRPTAAYAEPSPEPPRVEAAPAQPPPSSPARAEPKASKLRREESGERTVVYLPPDLATELRVLCARQRRSLSDALTEGVGLLLKAHSTSGPKA